MKKILIALTVLAFLANSEILGLAALIGWMWLATFKLLAALVEHDYKEG